MGDKPINSSFWHEAMLYSLIILSVMGVLLLVTWPLLFFVISVLSQNWLGAVIFLIVALVWIPNSARSAKKLSETVEE